MHKPSRRKSIVGWHLRLKRAREAVGMRQIDLAHRIGVSTATLSDWEAGKIDEPKASNLLAIADALGVAPDAILYGGPPGSPADAVAEDAAGYARPAPAGLSPELVRLWGELSPSQQGAVLATLRARVRENREVLLAFGGD